MVSQPFDQMAQVGECTSVGMLRRCEIWCQQVGVPYCSITSPHPFAAFFSSSSHARPDCVPWLPRLTPFLPLSSPLLSPLQHARPRHGYDDDTEVDYSGGDGGCMRKR